MSAFTNRRAALAVMFVLACATSLVLLDNWLGSLVAIAAALGVVVIAELSWHRAISTATSAGLVEPRLR
ncbi:hypothetical protein [Mycolicibacterium hodleri]|uniref:Phosphatidate cytidylyltransferase n=1 Tax=Mycolicibacterium hodleri TaxID=49897 RepID=A0A502EGX9_9MYCO|nr:hypothetical protein [Mycolicibacterium hodleri]TPG35760.1 hypothetical protein EAH80_06770 [Mycolicibacterium hodleri]